MTHEEQKLDARISTTGVDGKTSCSCGPKKSILSAEEIKRQVLSKSTASGNMVLAKRYYQSLQIIVNITI